MTEDNSFIIDIDKWVSNDPRLNEYLKTHDSISIRKKFIDNGERRRGEFTFYKDSKDCIYTLTIEDYEPLTIEFGDKENG